MSESRAESEPSPRRRRWYQYSLRTLLLLVLLASIGMSWVVVKMQKAKRQKEAANAIERLGGSAIYDYQMGSGAVLTNAEPPGPVWLRSILGDQFFAAVVFVSVKDDAGLEHIEEFDQLQSVNAEWSTITDEGLRHLRGMTALEKLRLCKTPITDAGLQHIKGLSRLQELLVDM